jgi:hypothetical protein
LFGIPGTVVPCKKTGAWMNQLVIEVAQADSPDFQSLVYGHPNILGKTGAWKGLGTAEKIS